MTLIVPTGSREYRPFPFHDLHASYKGVSQFDVSLRSPTTYISLTQPPIDIDTSHPPRSNNHTPNITTQHHYVHTTMVNTHILPSLPALRPPQIISLPLNTTPTSHPTNASSPNLTTPTTSRPQMPSRHSMDSSTSTSTISSISSTDSIPRSTPRTISTRSSFDPLSLPAEVPTDFSLPPSSAAIKAQLNRPRARSHGHGGGSYTSSPSSTSPSSSSGLSSSLPRSADAAGDGFLHPGQAAAAASANRMSYTGNYSAMTESFASLGLQSRTSSPVLRARGCEGLSEEVRLEMRMYRD
ncbi:hypothetical protein BDZ85DRAFT_264662 [Elsinoe ampelina]|uniref:Uncharacterized protein n=1 Tax=Elsinoe ampelina TaxID=302913 RepID=A0A6A6G8P6_9PEZI|nr:hypothetical protein BDZ85DRAFT_264662 [Elsinoe ampelina]